VLSEVEASREPSACAGQHDRRLGVITLKPVECLMQVTEEGAILRVDGIRRHRHDGDTTPPLDSPTHASSSVRADMGKPCRQVANADRRCIPQIRVGNLQLRGVYQT
jgi:hypothetical protein